MKNKVSSLSLLLMTAFLASCGSSGDTTPPTVTEVSTLAVITTPGTVNLSAKATDNVGIKQVDFYLDDAATPFASDTSANTDGKYEATLAWAATQNGTHTLRVVAVDTAGNRSASVTQTVTVNIVTDTTAPSVSITGLPSATVTAPATYTVTVNATDNVGVTSLHGVLTRQETNGQSTTLFDQTTKTTSFAVPLSLSASDNGTYTLRVTASDAAGNTTSTEQTITVNIPNGGTPPTPGSDTQPPKLNIIAPARIITPGNYNVTIEVTDNVAVASVTGTVQTPLGLLPLSGLSTSGGTVVLPVTNRLLNGEHLISITATDSSGNATTKTATVSVNIP